MLIAPQERVLAHGTISITPSGSGGLWTPFEIEHTNMSAAAVIQSMHVEPGRFIVIRDNQNRMSFNKLAAGPSLDGTAIGTALSGDLVFPSDPGIVYDFDGSVQGLVMADDETGEGPRIVVSAVDPDTGVWGSLGGTWRYNNVAVSSLPLRTSSSSSHYTGAEFDEFGQLMFLVSSTRPTESRIYTWDGGAWSSQTVPNSVPRPSDMGYSPTLGFFTACPDSSNTIALGYQGQWSTFTGPVSGQPIRAIDVNRSSNRVYVTSGTLTRRPGQFSTLTVYESAPFNTATTATNAFNVSNYILVSGGVQVNFLNPLQTANYNVIGVPVVNKTKTGFVASGAGFLSASSFVVCGA